MKLFAILGLADLLVLVSGHPHPGPASSIDVSKYRLPALSTYANNQKVSETRLFPRTSTDKINYLEAAEDFVRQTVPGLTFRLVDDHYVGKNGIAHVYFKQTVNGLDVGNADFNVNVDRYGNVFSHGSSFFTGELPTERSLSKRDYLEPVAALLKVIDLLGLPLDAGNVSVDGKGTTPEQYDFNDVIGTERNPTARLIYFDKGSGDLHLSWRIEINAFPTWLVTYIDAATGEDIHGVVEYGKPLTYEVYPWGVNDPSLGSRIVVEDPWLSVASPFTWVGNGSANYTTTQGNNAVAVHSPTDSQGDWQPKYRPNSPELSFEYPYNDRLSNPAEYRDAAITQLFYTSNVYHDLLYLLGFTEAAGNFQLNNNGLGGRDGDFVILQAQDGSGTNNAWFFPTVDGEPPRMLMWLWNIIPPTRDSSFDAGLVLHEYTHGVSSRLTGGPLNAQCLDTVEAGGLDEGWADFMAVAIMVQPNANRTSTYTMARWLLPGPTGIRPYLYSTNTRTNPLLYSYLARDTLRHSIGNVWANMLYEILWNLIDKYGKNDGNFPEFDENGVPTDGKFLAMQLVVDGLALQPCNPTLVSARDAMLDADVALTGGANACELWTGFAKRGLGAGAQPAVYVDDFSVPDGVCEHLRRAALMMHSFPWTAKPFQMAADENDPKGSRVDDPEFKALAKSIAIADMLCISMIASSLYKISEKQSPRLANSYDPWNEAPDYSSQAIQNLRQWPHAINAYKENVSLSEWLSVYDGAHPHGPAANLDDDHEYYIHEIVDITDDNWARQWDPIIGQIASDYNDIRYGHARPYFHWHYLKNAKYGELWRELFTAAVRLMGPNLYGDVVTKLETIKTSINAAASVLEGLVVGLIREVDDAIISAVKLRVIALGAVCEQVNARYQSVGRDEYWNTRLWQHNWYVMNRKALLSIDNQ
ncbi:hypothetical protein S40293_06589 [Stachybotrys chartarum IBT 40293]|nr:hypothetical protein S40293_06589 [Stachybotrys chartarum IBT 40293]